MFHRVIYEVLGSMSNKHSTNGAVPPVHPLTSKLLLPLATVANEKNVTTRERIDYKNSHSAQKAWPGPAHRLAKSMEVKAK